jgi:hypothetical protein
MSETDVEFFLCINESGEYRVLGSSSHNAGEVRSVLESGMMGEVKRLKIRVPLPTSISKSIDEVV